MKNQVTLIDSPRLLVSVRDAREATAALTGGCDILDVKEPKRGSLGMADVRSIGDVIAIARAHSASDTVVPVSAALGEAADWMKTDSVPTLPEGLDFVKLGLAGLGNDSNWSKSWLETRQQFERQTGSPLNWVAVAYADWRTADAPEPLAVIQAAIKSGCVAVLFDTFSKQGETLLDCLSADDLCDFGRQIRDAGLKWAVAGNLQPESLCNLSDAHPNIIAIRGAACREGRRVATIDAEAVGRFKTAVTTAFLNGQGSHG